MFKKRITPFACLLTALIVAIVTFVGVYSRMSVIHKRELNELRTATAVSSASGNASFGDDNSRYEKLFALLDAVDGHFLWDYDEDEVWDSIYSSALSALGDQYTYYITAEEFAERNKGSGGGVGIGVRRVTDAETGGIYVVDVMNGTPAMEAGLRRGDVIIGADGKLIPDNSMEDILTVIASGEEGSYVGLKVIRDGETLDISVKRGILPNDDIYSIELENGVWLVVITTFAGETVADEFIAEVDGLIENGAKGLIFDVRANNGGRLDMVTKMLDYLLPEGNIVTYTDYSGKVNTIKSDAEHIDIPMAVLCDKSTISAAELFTAAMKDFGAASIVGQTTFGKGIMQYVLELPDGSGYSITTSYYNPPSGVNYHGVGVVPEYEVELEREHDSEYYKSPLENDEQLMKAYEIITK